MSYRDRARVFANKRNQNDNGYTEYSSMRLWLFLFAGRSCFKSKKLQSARTCDRRVLVKTVSGRIWIINKISDLDEIMDPRSATFLPAATIPIFNILAGIRPTRNFNPRQGQKSLTPCFLLFTNWNRGFMVRSFVFYMWAKYRKCNLTVHQKSLPCLDLV